MSGWVKYHRSIEEWEWYDDAYTLKMFLFLISNANFEDKRWKGHLIKRGQYVTSLDSLSSRLNMSRKKTYLRLNKLVKSGEITKKGTSFTLITICNYDLYQSMSDFEGTEREQKGNRKGTERETTKEYKEIKNINIPDFLEFSRYAISKKPDIDNESLKLKYEAWKENGWKDGHGKKIKNWKSKLLNTLPYLVKRTYKTDAL